jgi:hypothetical protein
MKAPTARLVPAGSTQENPQIADFYNLTVPSHDPGVDRSAFGSHVRHARNAGRSRRLTGRACTFGGPMGEAMIKGGAIREFFAWYERKFGEGSIRHMARQVPADLAPLLDPDEPVVHFLASSWYPARLVHSMLDTMNEGRSELEIERLGRDATRHVVSNGMNSVYRVLLSKLGSPEIYARMIPRMWRQLHDTGDRSLVITGPGHATSRIMRWEGHHPTLCMLSTQLMCAIFEEMGCRDVRWRRVRCIGRTGPASGECVYDVTWKK